jgi:hypothetical protein
MRNLLFCILALSCIVLVLTMIIQFRKVGSEHFVALDSSYVYPKDKLSSFKDDTTAINQSYNRFKIYSLKPDSELQSTITTKKGFDEKGQQSIMCQASTISTIPKNIYSIVNQDAVCSIRPDAAGVSDVQSWDDSFVKTTGRVYLKPEMQLIGNSKESLRSGNGQSCTKQYINEYNKTKEVILLDSTKGQYYKNRAVDPECVTTPDLDYYMQVGVAPADSI